MALQKHTRGFTIVELLIVIVVIAILAAISVVAYTGIQNRAHDSAIQTDLRGAATLMEMYRINNSAYPTQTSHFQRLQNDQPLTVTKNAYDTRINNNFIICTRDDMFALAGQSKSGKAFAVTNMSGAVISYDNWAGGINANCSNLLGVDNRQYANWGYTNGSWQVVAP